ncbi:hypothetical protein F6Y02_01625 [Bacillus megaterium]|nr:hypothetical protein [Priestia megaterium]
MDEWAAALQFPDYFGENWAAFDECLNDLDWLPADRYILFITDAHLILKKKKKNFKILINILKTLFKNGLKVGIMILSLRNRLLSYYFFNVVMYIRKYFKKAC